MARDAHYHPVRDMYICVPHKSGITSFRHAIRAIHEPLAPPPPVTADEALATGRLTFLALRDPAERFMSLWRNWCRDHAHPEYPCCGLSPGEMLHYVSRNLEANRHWAPQARLWRVGVIPVRAFEVHARFGLPLAHLNRTVHQPTDEPTSPALLAKLRDVYAGDYALMEKLLG